MGHAVGTSTLSTAKPAALKTFWSDLVESASSALGSTLETGAKVLPVWFADQLGLQQKDQLAAPTRGRDAFRGSQSGERNTMDPFFRRTGFGDVVRSGDGFTIVLIGGALLVGVILLVRR